MQYLLALLCLSGFSLVKAFPLAESAIAAGASIPTVSTLRDVSYNLQKARYQNSLSARDVDDFAKILAPRGQRRSKRLQLGNNRPAQNDAAVPSGEQPGQRGQAPPLLRSGTTAPWGRTATVLGRIRRPSSGAAQNEVTRPERPQGLTAIRTPREQPGNRLEHLVDSPSSMYGSRAPSPARESPPRRSSPVTVPPDVPPPGLVPDSRFQRISTSSTIPRHSSSSTSSQTPPMSPTSRFDALPKEEKLRQELDWISKGKWTKGTQPFDGHPHGMTGEAIMQAQGRPPRERQQQRQQGRQQASQQGRLDLKGYLGVLADYPDPEEVTSHPGSNSEYDPWFPPHYHF